MPHIHRNEAARRPRPLIGVCCDAGSAGRDLLARPDLDVAWALTPEEAIALLDSAMPKVMLVREEVALGYLRGVLARKRKPPCIVLLEPDGWERRSAYFEAGAAVLVRASAKERILEAISELTGLAFAAHPRVPYPEILDVRVGDDIHFAQAVDLSVSGVALRDVPGAQLGSQVVVSFVMTEPPLSLPGLVVRVEAEPDGEVIGVCFDAPSAAERAVLEALLAAGRARLPPLPEPVGLTADLLGTFTLDLFTQNTPPDVAAANDLGMLRDLVRLPPGGVGPRVPRWLQRVAAELTALETAALLGGGPAFAVACAEVRLAIARARTESTEEVPSRALCERVLEFCRTLAGEAAGTDAPILAQVSRVRGALLRALYGRPPGGRMSTIDLKPASATRARRNAEARPRTA